jgi:hypothetical protein
MNPPTLETPNLQFGNEVGVFPFMYLVNARFLGWQQTRVAGELMFRLPACSACSLFRSGSRASTGLPALNPDARGGCWAAPPPPRYRTAQHLASARHPLGLTGPLR